MPISINSNTAALQAADSLQLNSQAFAIAVRQLSSGLRINSAADDPSGLAKAQKLQAQINGLSQSNLNTQSAISMLQTGDSALTTTQEILQRMRELAVQASNDTNTAQDRMNIQSEINQLVSEIDRIAQQTTFNTKRVLDGSAGAAQATGGGSNIRGLMAQAGVALNGAYTVNAPGAQQAIETLGGGAFATTSTFAALSTVVIQIGAKTATIVQAAGDTYQEFLNDVNTNATLAGQALATIVGGQLLIYAKNNGSDTTTTNTNLLSAYNAQGDFNTVFKLSTSAANALATATAANLAAYAEGAVTASGGVVTGFSTGSATGGPATYSAIEALGSVAPGSSYAGSNLAASSAVALEAGNGVIYTFAVNGGQTGLNVTSSDGSFSATGAGAIATDLSGGKVTFNTFVDAVNDVTGASGAPDPLHAAGVDINGNILPSGSLTSIGGIILNNTTAGVSDATHPGAPHALTITTLGSGSFAFNSGIALDQNPLANNARQTATLSPLAGRVLNAADAGATSFLAVGAENAVQNSSATRSAILSGNVAAGSAFTQASSLTVTGGLGSATFTAQSGETLAAFFQQVNSSSIGVTMQVDAASGKIVIFNSNFGGVDPQSQGGALATGKQVSDAPAQVNVSNASGDFGATGLNVNFTSGNSSSPGSTFTSTGNQGSVSATGTFLLNVAAVNASFTLTGPTGVSTTMTASGINSDTISGAGSLAGVTLTLANPNNVTSGDTFKVVQSPALQYQVGPDASQTIPLSIDSASSQALGVGSIDVLTSSDSQAAITQLDRAAQYVSAIRANIGAVLNRLTDAMTTGQAVQEQETTALSNLQDVNVAQETVQFTREQILQQAATSVLAQANQTPASLLTLLR